MAGNKVLFNLKSVHYAPMTAQGAAPTWGAPVAIPGAVSLALEQVGEISKFYADGIVYWQSSSNGGYEGDIEMANLPDQMFEDIWGMTKTTTDNVLIENANDVQTPFALLFEIDGDTSGRKYCLYNCSATRPDLAAETTGESKEPKPQKFSLAAAPLADGRIKANTADDTDPTVFQNWFTKVYEPAGK